MVYDDVVDMGAEELDNEWKQFKVGSKVVDFLMIMTKDWYTRAHCPCAACACLRYELMNRSVGCSIPRQRG